MKNFILYFFIFITLSATSQEVTGNAKIDKLYSDIIKNNNKEIHSWAKKVAKRHSGKKINLKTVSLPQSLKSKKLTDTDQLLLKFLVDAENYRITNKKILDLVKAPYFDCEKLRKLVDQRNKQEEEMEETLASSVLKKPADTGYAVIGKV